jgi:hypothetical protein
MQISATSTTSAVAQVQALTAAAQGGAPADAGQALPGEAAGASPPPPPGGAQLSDATLASLLDAQQADAGSAPGQANEGGGAGAAAVHHHHHHRHAGGAAPAAAEGAGLGG